MLFFFVTGTKFNFYFVQLILARFDFGEAVGSPLPAYRVVVLSLSYTKLYNRVPRNGKKSSHRNT